MQNRTYRTSYFLHPTSYLFRIGALFYGAFLISHFSLLIPPINSGLLQTRYSEKGLFKKTPPVSDKIRAASLVY